MASDEWTSPRWAYSDEEWRAILAAAPEASKFAHLLESEASGLLNLPTSAEVRRDLNEEMEFQRRINETTGDLLDLLSEMEAVHDRSLVQKLTDLLCSSEQAMDHLKHEIPHSNRLNGWGAYLQMLCLIGHRNLGLPITQRRRSDGSPYGPLVDFIVAAAGPVKMEKGPYNLTGPMTAETAHRAIRAYVKNNQPDDDAATAAIIAAVMAQDEPTS